MIYAPLQKAVEIVGSQTALAKAIGKRQGHIWNWLKAGRVPAEFCIAIERATDGQISRSDLRPDIYPDGNPSHTQPKGVSHE